MKNPLTIAALSLGVVVVIVLGWNIWSSIMGDNAATQDRIDSIGGESEKLRQQQQP
jgi:hypothetical protein